jgi:cytochrome c2
MAQAAVPLLLLEFNLKLDQVFATGLIRRLSKMLCTRRSSTRSDAPPTPTRNLRTLSACLLLTLIPATLFAADAFPDRPWGADSAAGRCVVCHSLEKGGPFRVAPNLWNIVGSEKARDSDWYAYSPSLIKMGGTWTEEELDRFLENASAFAPGSSKSIRVADPAERQAIIDFLKQLQD